MDARDERLIPLCGESLNHLEQCFRRLSFAEDHFGIAAAAGTVEVELNVAKIGGGMRSGIARVGCHMSHPTTHAASLSSRLCRGKIRSFPRMITARTSASGNWS